MKRIFINTDGGSRGNPGPAAIGVVFSDEKGNVLYSCKEYIGTATNNEAEYRALIKAFEVLPKSKWFTEHNGNGGEIVCRLDSQLVVEQVSGHYKVKQEHIKELFSKIENLSGDFKLDVKFIHVPREENRLADKLVNEALDEQKTNHASQNG